jgi:hypothetical protein
MRLAITLPASRELAVTPRRRRLSHLRFRPRFEVLESRDMPSIVAPTPQQPGPLIITGTAGDDHFVLQTKPGNPTRLQVSDDGGSSFTDVYYYGLTGIQINGLGGNDDLLINQSETIVGVGGGLTIQYDGGPGHDTLHLEGGPEIPTTVVYNTGPTVDAGTIVMTTKFRSLTVDFTHLSAVIDSMPAESLTVNLDDRDNFLKVGKEYAAYQQSTYPIKLQGIDYQGEHDLLDGLFDAGADSEATVPQSFVPLTIAGQASVRINTLGGDDVIALDDPRSADGFPSFVIDGGDGTDRVLQAHLPPNFTPSLQNIETVVTDQAIDELFVRELYHGSLRRKPTPAEVDDWLGVLHGPLGRAGVVDGIDRSSEAHARLVRGWYENYLGRTPAAAETGFWAEFLDRGATEESVLAQILGSPEFRQRTAGQAGADPTASFVGGLYQTLLGRAGSAGEIASWLDSPAALADHSQTVLDFLTAPELRGRFVEAAYRNFFERIYDADGKQYWVDSSLGFADIRRAFLLSDDFFNDSHTDPFGLSGSVTIELASIVTAIPASQFDASGHAEFTGTSSQDQDVFTWAILSAPRTGTIAVHVAAVNTPIPLVRVTDGFTPNLLLETQPWSQINSGQIDVQAGKDYLFSVRSPFNTPSDFVVDLDYLANVA